MAKFPSLASSCLHRNPFLINSHLSINETNGGYVLQWTVKYTTNQSNSSMLSACSAVWLCIFANRWFSEGSLLCLAPGLLPLREATVQNGQRLVPHHMEHPPHPGSREHAKHFIVVVHNHVAVIGNAKLCIGRCMEWGGDRIKIEWDRIKI